VTNAGDDGGGLAGGGDGPATAGDADPDW
jgi:hypothetical protein